MLGVPSPKQCPPWKVRLDGYLPGYIMQHLGLGLGCGLHIAAFAPDPGYTAAVQLATAGLTCAQRQHYEGSLFKLRAQLI